MGEENFSTEQYPPEKNPWFPEADVHQGWATGTEAEEGQREKETDRRGKRVLKPDSFLRPEPLERWPDTLSAKRRGSALGLTFRESPGKGPNIEALTFGFPYVPTACFIRE